jgi:peptidyl-tRNA hydrolase, PTH2 family
MVDRFIRRSGGKYKQVIIVRSDLKLPSGKLAAQVAHASVGAVMESDQKVVTQWHGEGMKKIVVKVKNKNQLMKYAQQAQDANLTTCVVKDAGHTIVEPGTVTCCGIGPDLEKDIDAVTGKLQIL